jgi:cellulose synthase/poly-beta-1,6-N-acetylglucosamine synthase-like glycosyltransferase
MLDQALLTSVAAVAALTIALLAAGRRPLAGTRWRWFVASCVVVASAVSAFVTGSSLPVALGVAIAVLSTVQARNWFAVGATFFAALLVATFVYAVYLARATLLLGIQPLSVVLGLVLLALEFGALALIVAAAFEMVDALCAPAEVAPEPTAPDRWPVVCLQVPTYNEPPDLVIETIRSLVALQYPELRIQVIDNNTADEGLWRPVEAECARLRDQGHVVQFVHLPEWPGYKAGALNWGRKHLAGEVEIVGVVDADYVVEPNWLRATVPHFGDPNVAFVQTPQDYRAWETSAFYRACYVGFAYFFKVGMVSRAHRNAIIFAGTMGLIRRAVLDSVGGWDERIITEDAEISLRVLALGARSIYVPQPFGRGIMPLTYEGLRKQRFRWAFGGMQILRRHWRTLLGTRSGLSFGQRYDHLIGGLWWLNDALTLGFTLFVSAAALGAITGRPFVVQRLTAIGLVLPIVYIVLNLLRYLWALRATTGASPALALAALRVNLSLSWVIALACVRGLVQERGVFLRTPKFRGSATIRELRVIWVEAALASPRSASCSPPCLAGSFSFTARPSGMPSATRHEPRSGPACATR